MEAEDYGRLDGIVGDLKTSGLLKDKWQLLTKYLQCVRGPKLVKWLVGRGHAKSTEEAVILAHRLYDASLIHKAVPSQLKSKPDFVNRRVLYSLTQPYPEWNVGKRFVMDNRVDVVKDAMVFEGTYTVNLATLYLLKAEKELYVFRSSNSSRPRDVIPLQDCGFYIADKPASFETKYSTTTTDGADSETKHTNDTDEKENLDVEQGELLGTNAEPERNLRGQLQINLSLIEPSSPSGFRTPDDTPTGGSSLSPVSRSSATDSPASKATHHRTGTGNILSPSAAQTERKAPVGKLATSTFAAFNGVQTLSPRAEAGSRVHASSHAPVARTQHAPVSPLSMTTPLAGRLHSASAAVPVPQQGNAPAPGALRPSNSMHRTIKSCPDLKPVLPDFVAYLHLVPSNGPYRRYTFRLTDKDQRTKWTALMKDLNVKLLSSQEVKGEFGQSTLDLSDVLMTPEYRETFLRFLQKQYAVENLKFLEAVDTYKQLQDHARRAELGRRIYAMFVDPDHAKELVNLDSVSFAKIKERVDSNQYRKDLFDRAAEVIFKMVSKDVYMRFVTSPEYMRMLDSAKGGVTPMGRLRVSTGMARTSSFCIPTMDDAKELRELGNAVFDSGVLKPLKKHTNAITGKGLIDWLILQDKASIRPVAAAMCQRLLDGGVMRAVKDEWEFQDSEAVYTFDLPPSLAAAPSAGDLRTSLAAKAEKSMSRESSVSYSTNDKRKNEAVDDSPLHFIEGELLLKGLRYNRVHCILDVAKRTLYIYRSRNAAHPIRILALKGVPCRVETRKEETVEDVSFGMSPKRDQGNNNAQSNAIHYVMCGDVVFRADTEADQRLWKRGIDALSDK